MRVRLAYPRDGYRAGHVVELEDSAARQLIRDGLAAAADDAETTTADETPEAPAVDDDSDDDTEPRTTRSTRKTRKTPTT